jgi:phosphatidylethanolamine-binding protein (PEBP) family uncharacterized protein
MGFDDIAYVCLWFILVTAVFVYVGCAQSQRTPPAPDVVYIRSPALSTGGVLPNRYRCGSGSWLPLSWGDLPRGTAQLALYIGSYGAARKIGGGWRWRPIATAALIVGIPPHPNALRVGGLPLGAVEISGLPRGGVPGAKPSLPICPDGHSYHRFMFRLYALGRHAKVLPATSGAAAYEELLRVVHSALSTTHLLAVGR